MILSIFYVLMKTIYLLWWPIFWNFCLFKKLGFFFLIIVFIHNCPKLATTHISITSQWVNTLRYIPATKFSAMKRMEPLIHRTFVLSERSKIPKVKMVWFYVGHLQRGKTIGTDTRENTVDSRNFFLLHPAGPCPLTSAPTLPAMGLILV